MKNVVWWIIWGIPMVLFVITAFDVYRINAVLYQHTKMIESLIERPR